MTLGSSLQLAIHYASVFLAWGLATLCYYLFSHYVYHRQFDFEHHTVDIDKSGHQEDHLLLHVLADEQSGHKEHSGKHEDHHHGRREDLTASI